jgi:hypothetical protein
MMRRMLLALCLIPAMLMAEEELKMYSHVYLKLHSGEVY